MATKDSSASLHNIEDTSRNEKIKFTAKHISPTSNLHSKDTSVDPNQVNLEGADDQNPKDWPLWQKWCIVTLVATMFMLNNFGTIIIVPAVPQVLSDLKTENHFYSTLIVSIWELGEGFGPFLVGPLSELYGRMPIYHAGNVLFILCSVAAAFSTNISMLLAFRFLNGFVITSSTLGPSIIGDLFVSEDRGKAMAAAIALPLTSPFIAPILGSVIAKATGWRWTIKIIAIAVGAVTCLSLLEFRETYHFKILKNNAARLRRKTGSPDILTEHHKQNESSFIRSMTRPMSILFRSPIVFIITFYTALTYSLSYLILTTLTLVMEDKYNFSEGNVGYLFLGRAAGNVMGMILYGFVSDRYMKYKRATEGRTKPEHRLLLMVLGSIALPVGLLIYGWSAARHVYWIVPIIGTGVVGFSMLLTILPTENYLIDIYEVHGASAVAAGVIMRALFGAMLPLTGPPMYSALGLGWGNSVLAFVTLVFVPILFLLMRYGERIRLN